MRTAFKHIQEGLLIISGTIYITVNSLNRHFYLTCTFLQWALGDGMVPALLFTLLFDFFSLLLVSGSRRSATNIDGTKGLTVYPY